MALATAILLLLCQTAFATQACAHFVAPVGNGAVTAPCHEAAGDGTAGVPLAPPTMGVCDAGKAIGDSAKVQVYTLSDLPAVAVAYSPVAAPRVSPVALQTVRAVCHSPPLSILHCRFIN